MPGVMETRKTTRRGLQRGGPISVPMFSHGLSGIEHYFGTKSEPGPVLSRTEGPGMGVVSVKQVHGTEVLTIDRRITNWATFEDEILSEGYDAIVTNQPNLLLSIQTADCVPVLFLDEVRRVIAVAHAGWRGTVAGIVTKTLQVMQDRFRCHPRTIRVAIGPSIGACCYEVDGAVLTPLKRAFPSWSGVVDGESRSRAYLDLRGLNRWQLEAAGVNPSRIETVNLCTACRPELFYSYRRDGKGTGRMTSGIGLTSSMG
jgi:YfiH family protein